MGMGDNIKSMLLATVPTAGALVLTVARDPDNPGWRTVAQAVARTPEGDVDLNAHEGDVPGREAELEALDTALEDFIEARRLEVGTHTLTLEALRDGEGGMQWGYVVTLCGRSRRDDGLMTEAPTVHASWADAREHAVSRLLANVEDMKSGEPLPSRVALLAQVPPGAVDFDLLHSDDAGEWKASVTLTSRGERMVHGLKQR